MLERAVAIAAVILFSSCDQMPVVEDESVGAATSALGEEGFVVVPHAAFKSAHEPPASGSRVYYSDNLGLTVTPIGATSPDPSVALVAPFVLPPGRIPVSLTCWIRDRSTQSFKATARVYLLQYEIDIERRYGTSISVGTEGFTGVRRVEGAITSFFPPASVASTRHQLHLAIEATRPADGDQPVYFQGCTVGYRPLIIG
jgi:hypothetical protein